MLRPPTRLTLDPKIAYVIPEGLMPSEQNTIGKDIPFELPWWTKAWNWFRKWGWIPAGFVILVLGFVLGGVLFRRRDGKVITPLDDIREAVRQHDEEVDAEIEAARQAHVDEVIRIEREHQEQLDKLTEDQERRRQEYRKNPKRLARWLTGLARGEDDG